MFCIDHKMIILMMMMMMMMMMMININHIYIMFILVEFVSRQAVLLEKLSKAPASGAAVVGGNALIIERLAAFSNNHLRFASLLDER